MIKARTLLLVALVVVLLGIHFGVGALGGAPAHAQPSLALPSAEQSTSSDWNISGDIQQMNGQFWMVQGFLVKVTDATHASGDVPSIGVSASATGIVLGAGTSQ